MKRTDFIAVVAERTGVTKKQAEAIISTTFSCIGDVLAQGDRFGWSGFGSFETHERAEREGRIPSTGEIITIPASVVPVFKPSKQLKEKINKP